MRGDLSLKRPEAVNVLVKHRAAGTVGGILTALICGGFGAAASGPIVAALMAVIGLAIGAVGGASMAESAETTWKV
jgi:hypothetical protein